MENMEYVYSQPILVKSATPSITSDALRSAFGRMVESGEQLQGVDYVKRGNNMTFWSLAGAKKFIGAWNDRRAKLRKYLIEIDWENAKELAGESSQADMQGEISGANVPDAVGSIVRQAGSVAIACKLDVKEATLAALESAFKVIAQSSEPFPVDFDDAWQWVGYSTKGNARRKLESDFNEGCDYRLINIDKPVTQGGFTRTHQIYLTVDCFKAFCMMAATERGKEVRSYYLEVEKRYQGLSVRSGEISIVNPADEAIARMSQDVDIIRNQVVIIGGQVSRLESGQTSMMQQLEDIAHGAKALQVKQEKILDSLASIAYLVDKEGRSNRLRFGEHTQRAARMICAFAFDGCCPFGFVNEDFIRIIDLDTYEPLSQLEYHHIDGNRSENRLHNCMPLSRKWHRAYTSDSSSPTYEEARATWRTGLRRYSYKTGHQKELLLN